MHSSHEHNMADDVADGWLVVAVVAVVHASAVGIGWLLQRLSAVTQDISASVRQTRHALDPAAAEFMSTCMCRPCSCSHQDTPPQTRAPLLSHHASLHALCCVLRAACSGGAPTSLPRTGGTRMSAWRGLPFAPRRLFQCSMTEVSHADPKLSCRGPALAGLSLHADPISAGRGCQSRWCLDAAGAPIDSRNECCAL